MWLFVRLMVCMGKYITSHVSMLCRFGMQCDMSETDADESVQAADLRMGDCDVSREPAFP